MVKGVFMSCLFENLRQSARLSRSSCATYLQVNISTINRWIKGTAKPSYAVYELLRCVAGYIPAVSCHKSLDFKGWRFVDEYIYTSDGDRFTAGDILAIKIMYQQLSDHRSTIKALKGQVKLLKSEVLSMNAPVVPDNVIKFPTFARS